MGLIGLLDDVVGLAKIAAASLDDAAAQTARAGVKAAGVVVDDAAVTPRYVVGFAADRELPIIGRIALGSLKNKLLFLLPISLVLSLFAPWAITPLLMLGGAYLCFEGAEKICEAFWPHHGEHGDGSGAAGTLQTPKELEDEKVSGAVKTDLILSAEIMAITLATVAAETPSFWSQALVLAVVGIGITVMVYGAVALIVKADDVGVALAQNDRPVTTALGLRPRSPDVRPNGADRAVRPVSRTLGRGLVVGMPPFLKVLSIVGTAAMLWVGGGIIVHGLESYGLPDLGHAIHDLAAAAGHALPSVGEVAEWLVTAGASGLVGLMVGGALIPVATHVAGPALRKLKG